MYKMWNYKGQREMTTKTEILNKIEELKQIAATMPDDDTVWPKEDDVFYYVESSGNTIWDRYCPATTSDQCRKSCGNMFRTREEAKMFIKTKKRMLELSKPFTSGENNCLLTYSHKCKKWETYQMTGNQDVFSIYFTLEDANNIIAEHKRGKIDLNLTLGRVC